MKDEEVQNLKPGDKLRIIDSSKFKEDCRWLQGQIVEVIRVTGEDFYRIQAKHPKEPFLFFRAVDVEKVEE